MEIPESGKTVSSSIGAEGGGQPPVSRHAEAREAAQKLHQEELAGGVQGIEDNPLEIERVDSSRAGVGVSRDRSNVDTNLNEGAEAGTSYTPSSNNKDISSDAGPSSSKGGTATGGDAGIGIDEKDKSYALDEGRSSGAEGGRAGSDEKLFKEGDPPRQQQRQQQEVNDPSSLEGSTGGAAAAAGTEAGETADIAADQRFRSPAGTFIMPTSFPSLSGKSSEHLIDIPFRMGSKAEELDAFKRFGIPRTLSNFSRASVESAGGDQCRICQQHTEEPLMELGCQCRGELAKAHRSCIDHWFGNKGTNKCEVCQHVATNVPPPSSQPSAFWVWRVGGPYNATPRRIGGARFHPLWAALLILIAGLLFDILISIFLGASALPVNIIIGVLVVLGLGTAARLVLECWHERAIRRNIRRMEDEPNFQDFTPEQTNDVNIPVEPVEGQPSTNGPSPSPGIPGQQGSAEASVTASVAATSALDVENR